MVVFTAMMIRIVVVIVYVSTASSILVGMFNEQVQHITLQQIPFQADSCSFCWEEFVSNEYLAQLKECNHVFHKGCFIEMFPLLKKQRTCPMCRADVKKVSFMKIVPDASGQGEGAFEMDQLCGHSVVGCLIPEFLGRMLVWCIQEPHDGAYTLEELEKYVNSTKNV